MVMNPIEPSTCDRTSSAARVTLLFMRFTFDAAGYQAFANRALAWGLGHQVIGTNGERLQDGCFGKKAIVKNRVFHADINGLDSPAGTSWFALRTDDPKELAQHVRGADLADLKRHFANGDFEVWLRDLYKRPDLAEAARRLREAWNGHYIPRAELIAILESTLHRAS